MLPSSTRPVRRKTRIGYMPCSPVPTVYACTRRASTLYNLIWGCHAEYKADVLRLADEMGEAA